MFRMKQVLFAVVCSMSTVVHAQDVATAKARVDSIRTDLRKYCKTTTAVKYLCPVDTLRLARVSAALSPASTPTPTPIPTPVPTPVPAPIPIDSANAVELPRVFLNTAVSNTPSTGRTLHVAEGGNLQAALDSAQNGDKILIDACATFTGNFTYGAHKSGGIAGQWVTVQSAGQIPAEGTRASPVVAHAFATCYPKLVSTNGLNTLASRPNAAFWRFVGIEITVDSASAFNQGTVLVGDASDAQNTLAMIPADIILDRVYVHGQPKTDMRKCIALNSARSAVIDSYVSDCHSQFDAQAITGTNGPGPFKIVNNYLEGAAENIAWGGADPHVAGLVPSDIEIRHNHFFKPLTWKGSQWLEKNVIESKNSTRVLVEGNVLENSWNHAQVGYSFALWSVNQDGSCSWCQTSHWTIRNNMMVNVSAGVNLTARWERSPSIPAHHFLIVNNVWTGYVDYSIFQMDSIHHMTFEHNTGVGGTGYNFGVQSSQSAVVFRNNIVSGYYAVSAPWGSSPTWKAWNGVGGGLGSSWSFNVTATAGDGWEDPAHGIYAPQTWNDVGWTVTAPEGSVDRLVLAPTSLYKNKGSDGKDPGADITAVKVATAGVVVTP